MRTIMTLKMFYVCFFLYLPLFATSFSFGESIEICNQNEFTDVILENQNYCLNKVINNKAYLKVKNIYPTNEGIFLRISKFHLVKLESVLSDNEGSYVYLE